MDNDTSTNSEIGQVSKKPDKQYLLSFKPTGRILTLNNLEGEFRLMKSLFPKGVTISQIKDMGLKSGTHLLKTINARAEKDQAILRIQTIKNYREDLMPSVPSASIPVAKLIFRPLEIEGYEPQSVVDAISNPNEISPQIKNAFAKVFGLDCLDALSSVIIGDAPLVVRLPADNFPIIFLPDGNGGDLQVTPVSPAASYMDMTSISAPYRKFRKRSDPPFPRGKWARQAALAQMQNISGMIYGDRFRFLAELPLPMQRSSVEIFKYVKGGRFPSFRDASIADKVIRLDDLVETSKTVNSKNIRDGAKNLAKWLIEDALNFADDILSEALIAHQEHGTGHLSPPPLPESIIMGRWWGPNFDRARRVLRSSLFRETQTKIMKERA